ncbi:hypothetical protein LUZ61_003761 [Rhynchospora tenuis]|uniref:EF-hand domain-containing protein n=1 Tax=Rhynchospora tenuis TaxID=198213 RepID=A0AAD5ZLK3_9POAL|nr:hypothetical protein LUZ61_003761 [Rhynchospora tenuis]
MVPNCIPTGFNSYYLKYLAYFGIFIPQSDSTSCPVENFQENRTNVSQFDNDIDVKEVSITRVDLKNVMQDVCQFSTEEEDIGDNMLDYQEFFALFEDKEPSLDEIWEAFSIFDQDSDGFFDARDLQRVLINLGLQGGTNLNTCQHMIELYDRGGDRKINSSDFCRILESSLL